MNTDVGKSDLTYLHGIRVLSMFWIIYLHADEQAYRSLKPIGKYNILARWKHSMKTVALTRSEHNRLKLATEYPYLENDFYTLLDFLRNSQLGGW